VVLYKLPHDAYPTFAVGNEKQVTSALLGKEISSYSITAIFSITCFLHAPNSKSITTEKK
jgi:hypothetical protein